MDLQARLEALEHAQAEQEALKREVQALRAWRRAGERRPAPVLEIGRAHV